MSELPGMWDDSDLAGGETESPETRIEQEIAEDETHLYIPHDMTREEWGKI